MQKPSFGADLRAKLGPAAIDDLSEAFEEAKADMLAASLEQFDTRMDARFAAFSAEIRGEIARTDANLRVAMTEGFSKVRSEMAEMRVDVIRWSFLFWIGQVVALGSLITYLLRGH